MLQQSDEVNCLELVREIGRSHLHVRFFFTLAHSFKVGSTALPSFGTKAAVNNIVFTGKYLCRSLKFPLYCNFFRLLFFRSYCKKLLLCL